MRSRNSIRLFEYEGKTVLFGVIAGFAFSIFRLIRCNIMLSHLEIAGALSAGMFFEGYIFEDIGSGFFDNALLGINIFIPCVLLAALLENRYDSEKAYYFCRFGMNRYFADNILLSALLLSGYECLQLLVYIVYIIIFVKPAGMEQGISGFIGYLFLYYICLFWHLLITWLVWSVITGFLQYLIPLLLIIGEINITALMSAKRLIWCPLSVISFSGIGSGRTVLFMIWLLFLCFAAGGLIAVRKRFREIL